MRVEWDLANFKIWRQDIASQFQPLADTYNMTWQLHFSDDIPRMAIFVSKQSHCLYDILSRWQSGEFPVDIPLIISNHPDLEPIAQKFDIPYHVDVTNKTVVIILLTVECLRHFHTVKGFR